VPLALAVKEWRAALTQLLALRELVTETRTSDDQWREKRVAKDTGLLVRRARHAPVDATATTKLLTQVAQQTRWYRHCAEAWELRMQLIAAGGDGATRASAIQLDEVLNDDTTAMARTAEQQDELDAKLADLVKQLNEIRDDTEAAPATSLAPSEHELQAGFYRAQLGLLHAAGAAPLSAQLAATSTWGLLAAGDAADPQAPAPPLVKPQREGVWRNPSQLRRRYRQTDILLSLIVVVVTSLLYTATVYDETWGDWADWATAFGAGFLGKVAIQWTLLPIYRSLRIRAADAKAAGGDGAAAAAQADALVATVGG
jgi:hypothetical protein